MNGTTRVVEAGVVAKYILGDPMAPWHGGAASLTTRVHQEEPRGDEEVHRRLRRRRRARAHEARRGAAVHEGLHGDRGAADQRGAARVLHVLQRVRRRRRSRISRSSTTSSPRRASSRRRSSSPTSSTRRDDGRVGISGNRRARPASAAAPAPRKAFPWGRLLPVLGPVVPVRRLGHGRAQPATSSRSCCPRPPTRSRRWSRASRAGRC